MTDRLDTPLRGHWLGLDLLRPEDVPLFWQAVRWTGLTLLLTGGALPEFTLGLVTGFMSEAADAGTVVPDLYLPAWFGVPALILLFAAMVRTVRLWIRLVERQDEFYRQVARKGLLIGTLLTVDLIILVEFFHYYFGTPTGSLGWAIPLAVLTTVIGWLFAVWRAR